MYLFLFLSVGGRYFGFFFILIFLWICLLIFLSFFFIWVCEVRWLVWEMFYFLYVVREFFKGC